MLQDGEKEARTEAMVDKVAGEPPHQQSQLFQAPRPFPGIPQGAAGLAGEAWWPGCAREPESRRAVQRSTFYASFSPLIPCSAGAEATGAYPHLANGSPKGMGFITHIRHTAGVRCKSICLSAGPCAGTQVSLMNC